MFESEHEISVEELLALIRRLLGGRHERAGAAGMPIVRATLERLSPQKRKDLSLRVGAVLAQPGDVGKS